MGRWSKQGCINSAQKYDDLKTWIRERKTAYLAARDNGWLDECSAHMGINTSDIEWTKEECILFAKKYDNQRGFASYKHVAYAATKRNSWILECTSQMTPFKKVRTLELCKVAARRFTSPSSWYYNDSSTYIYACNHGWMEECCAHMKKHMDSITKNMCLKSAASFNSFKDFYMGDHIHFAVARENRWLPEIKDIFYERNARAWIEKNLGGADGQSSAKWETEP